MLRGLFSVVILALAASSGVQAEWNWTTPLPAPRWYPSSCTFNGYIYVTGGEQGATGHNNVWFVQPQEDGSLGPWSSTVSLPSGRMYHGCVAHNGYIYVLGGWGAGSYRNTVWYAQIQEDGSIAPWVTTTSLPAARDGIGCVEFNGYIYLIGGYNGSGDSPTVWFAPILEDGSVGLWDETTPMPAVRRCHGACAHNGYLYITGGFTMGALPTAHNHVWYAEVQENGTIGPWISTAALPSAQYGHPCSAYSEYLYVTGGQTAFSYFSSVLEGQILNDGSIDLWSSGDNLPESRTGHCSCVCQQYLYVLGGVNGSGNLSTVQYASVVPPAEVETDKLQVHGNPIQLMAYPGADRGTIQIEYQIASAHGNDGIPVSLNMYDASGRLLHTLVNGEVSEGNHNVQWKAGRSGVYLLRLSTPFAEETRKVVAVR